MIERQFFHYSDLEEYRDGMWALVGGEQRAANAIAAAELMRDSEAFYTAITRAFDEWPNSCAHNLSAENSNRLAWLGHAGCLLGIGSPEENTRKGWHLLMRNEQDEANRVAQVALDEWCEANADQTQITLFPLWST